MLQKYPTMTAGSLLDPGPPVDLVVRPRQYRDQHRQQRRYTVRLCHVMNSLNCSSVQCGHRRCPWEPGSCPSRPSSLRAAAVAHRHQLMMTWPPVRPMSHQLLFRRLVFTAAAQHSADEGGAKAAIQENIERAAKLLDEMLEEVMRTLFVEQAAAYISEEGPALSEEDAVRRVVVQRIEFLDTNFLAALNGYIQVTKKQKDAGELVPLLELMRSQVLYQVSLRLPSAAQVLNLAVKEVDKDDRLQVLRTALAGGAADLPGCDADSLSTASTQFIDDMEDQDVVADRRLLARLCLVREEVRWVSAEASFMSPASSTGDEVDNERVAATQFSRSNVPQRPAAFIKQLVSVNEPAMRIGLISRAFCEDWEGAAPRQKPQSAAMKGQPDFVRPGRFMSTIHAMIQNMEGEGSIQPITVGPGVLRRLADIQMEAINVLDRMQRGELKPPPS